MARLFWQNEAKFTNAFKEPRRPGHLKAKPMAGGLVSDMAYQPEYLQLRGLMDQLRKTAAEKNRNLSGDGSGVGRRQDERTRR